MNKPRGILLAAFGLQLAACASNGTPGPSPGPGGKADGNEDSYLLDTEVPPGDRMPTFVEKGKRQRFDTNELAAKTDQLSFSVFFADASSEKARLYVGLEGKDDWVWVSSSGHHTYEADPSIRKGWFVELEGLADYGTVNDQKVAVDISYSTPAWRNIAATQMTEEEPNDTKADCKQVDVDELGRIVMKGEISSTTDKDCYAIPWKYYTIRAELHSDKTFGMTQCRSKDTSDCTKAFGVPVLTQIEWEFTGEDDPLRLVTISSKNGSTGPYELELRGMERVDRGGGYP